MKQLIILAIILLLFLSACTTQKTHTYNIGDIYKGSDALKLNFMQNSPPKEVFENDEFPVIVELENKGASDIENGYLVFSLEKDYMDLIKWHDENLEAIKDETKAVFNLKGKSLDSLDGDKKTVYATIKAKTIDPQSELHTSAVRIISCYDYQTKLMQDVCVDADPYKLKPIKKPCEMKDISLNSQGAPIAVTKVEPRILTQENNIVPTFMIYIENVGLGQPYQYEKSYEACSSLKELEKEDYKTFFNQIKVEAKLWDDELDCNKEFIKLDEEKKGSVRCELNKGINKESLTTYTTSLKVTLSYGYTQTISKDVEIKKIPK